VFVILSAATTLSLVIASAMSADTTGLNSSEFTRLADVDLGVRHPDQTRVSFAGGIVNLRLPGGWAATEWPRRREMRVVLQPADLNRASSEVRIGVWLGFHRRLPGVDSDRMPDAALCEQRINAAIPGGAVSTETGWIFVAGQRMLRQEFRAAGDRTSTSFSGFHVLGKTEYGWFECQAVADETESSAILPTAEQLLTTIDLRPPMDESRFESPLAATKTPVGSWKSYRGLMRIRPDGHVSLTLDRPGTYTASEDGGIRFDRALVRLTGRYDLSDNLLAVTWSDGSRQNFRWKFSREGDLLLTDHHGRIAQLNWLYE